MTIPASRRGSTLSMCSVTDEGDEGEDPAPSNLRAGLRKGPLGGRLSLRFDKAQLKPLAMARRKSLTAQTIAAGEGAEEVAAAAARRSRIFTPQDARRRSRITEENLDSLRTSVSQVLDPRLERTFSCDSELGVGSCGRKSFFDNGFGGGGKTAARRQQDDGLAVKILSGGAPNEGLRSSLASEEDSEARDTVKMCFEILPVWVKKNDVSRGEGARRTMKSCHRTMSRGLFEQEAQDHLKQQQATWCIKPGSAPNIIWDSLGLAQLTWDCFAVPLAIFNPPSVFSSSSPLAWFGRVYWLVNIAVSFCTGYIDNMGGLVMNRNRIAKRYSMTWLPLDVLIVLSDWIEASLGTDEGQSLDYVRIGMVLRSLRMVRTVRLLRAARTPLVSSNSDEQMRSEELQLVAQVCKLMAGILVLAHFIACLWFAVGTVDPLAGWVRVLENFAEGPFEDRYLTSLLWSMAMLVGEVTGTTSEKTNLEKIFTVAVLFGGFMISSTLLGSLTTAMTRLQIISSKQSQEMSTLRKYLVMKNISRPLAVRIQRNAQHALKEQKLNMPESDVSLLKLISLPLMMEIHYETFFPTLSNHPYFRCLHDNDPAGIRKICHQCVGQQQLSAGDVLFAAHECPIKPALYFVLQGDVHYLQDATDTSFLVSTTEWLCEPVLWTTWRHRGTLRASTEARLVNVDATEFRNVFAHAVDIHVACYAAAYVQIMNELETDVDGGPSDIGEYNMDMEEIICWAFPALIDEDRESGEEGEAKRFSRSSSRLVAASNSDMGRGDRSSSHADRGSMSFNRKERRTRFAAFQALSQRNFVLRALWRCVHVFNRLVGRSPVPSSRGVRPREPSQTPGKPDARGSFGLGNGFRGSSANNIREKATDSTTVRFVGSALMPEG
mmetsp:Transcript_54408/g.165298  ORF Transcript_54408/g.165298 Transcript_54408/m.165298 type:complete len:889 (-) Transcript_54408:98-2764(-)